MARPKSPRLRKILPSQKSGIPWGARLLTASVLIPVLVSAVLHSVEACVVLVAAVLGLAAKELHSKIVERCMDAFKCAFMLFFE